MNTNTVAALLSTAGGHGQGEPTREKGFIVRACDPDDSDYIDGNTARMTVADVGRCLLRHHHDVERSRDLVPDGAARPPSSLLLLGYILSTPPWWRAEASRDHQLSWLYCDSRRITVQHLPGRMFARRGDLLDVCSGYLVRVQLNCLIA